MPRQEAMTLTRRDMLKASAGAVALGAGLAMTSGGAQGDSPARPHILLIMADQFRADCVGADGNNAIQTPHLDRIAAEGVRFRCAYSSTPTCVPARAALLTGLSPWHHGMLGMTAMAERYPFEMPRALREAGYYTMGIGKMHYSPARNGHGFHEMLLDEAARAESSEFRSDYISWFMAQAPNARYDATGLDWNGYESKAYALPEHLHPTFWTGETAVQFLKTYERPEPFFLKVSFHRPHSPYDPPERFMRMYENADLPKAYAGHWAARFAPHSDDTRHPWHGDFGPEQVRRSRQGYYGSVSFVDEQIGRILQALEARGMLENTLILFTADHGDMTGDHHLWRKSYAYESSARIPMLLRCPAGLMPAERGMVREQPVELRDVLPTFLDAAGVAAPGHLDGKSLLTLLRGDSPDWRPYIDLEHNICYAPENHWNALTDGKRKYIYHAHSGGEQFFDLERDPHEEDDLAGVSPRREEVNTWRDRLIAHLSERGEAYVKDGRMVPRPQNMALSPHFPQPS